MSRSPHPRRGAGDDPRRPGVGSHHQTSAPWVSRGWGLGGRRGSTARPRGAAVGKRLDPGGLCGRVRARLASASKTAIYWPGGCLVMSFCRRTGIRATESTGAGLYMGGGPPRPGKARPGQNHGGDFAARFAGFYTSLGNEAPFVATARSLDIDGGGRAEAGERAHGPRVRPRPLHP